MHIFTIESLLSIKLEICSNTNINYQIDAIVIVDIITVIFNDDFIFPLLIVIVGYIIKGNVCMIR